MPRAAAVPLRALVRYETQCDTVVAVAQSGRRRAVVKNVSLVSGTPHAMVFGARHDQLKVLLRGEAAGNQGEETRPSGAAVVFHLRAEERQRAGGTHKHAGALLRVER